MRSLSRRDVSLRTVFVGAGRASTRRSERGRSALANDRHARRSGRLAPLPSSTLPCLVICARWCRTGGDSGDRLFRIRADSVDVGHLRRFPFSPDFAANLRALASVLRSKCGRICSY
jgi:hypothetical protein